MSKRARRSSKKSSTKGLTAVNYILLAIYAVLSLVAVWLMFSNNILNFRNLNIIFAGLLLIVFLISLGLILTKRLKVFTTVLIVLFTIISGFSLYSFKTASNLANRINSSSKYSEVVMSVVVPADSDIESLSDLKSVASATSSDSINIDQFIQNVKSTKNVDLKLDEVDSYQKAYEQLIAGESEAMIWSSAYESLIALEDEDYESKIKKIYSYTIQKEAESSETKENNTDLASDSFNIYISGIDTYGSITSVSRSDVNIIMTINRKTHEILLTTTPRDSYLQIPDGGNNQYDKLTHAGIYGVETSMKTLANLYDIDLDYYVRLNFTSFLNLIDAVGDVEVYNDQAFTSYNGGYEFEVGNVTLDKERALAFVRERYNLDGGDNDRGKNQAKVIAAIINKMTSMSSVTKVQSIISTLESSIQTNIESNDLMQLVNDQLDSGESYKITSQAVEGTGSTGELTSYAMPSSSLYMLQLSDDSVDEAKKAINNVLEGN